METKNLRIGDLVQDTRNYNFVQKIDADSIGYAKFFSPIKISGEWLKNNGFVENFGAYIIEGEDVNISLKMEGDLWKTTIINGDIVYAGYISDCHELQHLVLDCAIDFEFNEDTK